MKNAKSIVDWIAWAEPQYDFNPMIDEWCKEAPKELDFNHEAGMHVIVDYMGLSFFISQHPELLMMLLLISVENTRKVSRNLGCKSNREDISINHVDVLIPEVIMVFSFLNSSN